MLVLEPIVQIGNLMLMVFKFALLTITTMTPKLTMSAPVLTSSPFPSPLLTPSSYSSSLSSSLPPSPKTSEKSSKIITKKSQKKLSHSNQKTGCSAQSCKGDSDFQICYETFPSITYFG